MHWKLKAAAFQVLETLPFGDSLHFLAQRHITRNWPRRERNLDLLIETGRIVIDDYARWGQTSADRSTFLEVGAGRDLAVPLSLRLLGAGKVITTDIKALARLDLVNHAMRYISQRLGMPSREFGSWADLRDFGIDYRAPVDLREANGLPPIDAFISNEVFEHIPPEALEAILVSVHRVMREGGVSIHSIDYSDHYARGCGVSRYNFLQYGDKEWVRYTSGYQYVNRLRHSQYIDLFKRSGFEICLEEPVRDEIPESILANLAEEFSRFEPDDLRIKAATIIARKVVPSQDAA